MVSFFLAGCGIVPQAVEQMESQLGEAALTAEFQPPPPPGQGAPPPDPDTTPADANEPAAPAAAEGPCHRAAAGRPIDVTIPDGTVLREGEGFTKTWRLMNQGSCAWDEAYGLVWFSGETFDAPQRIPLRGEVAAGESVDISVEMTAPIGPAVYQGNWILQAPDGSFFGIGPSGKSPFWVRVEVVQDDAAVLSVTPTAAAQVNILASGEATLYLQDDMDLDQGQINADAGDEMRFVLAEAGAAQLELGRSTRMAVFGAREPQIMDCQSIPLGDEPILLESLRDGVYVCYATNRGLYGFLQLSRIDLEEYILNVEYVTWIGP